MDPATRRTGDARSRSGTTEFHRRQPRAVSEPGLGVPRPGTPPPERSARRLVALAALVLLALAAWTVWTTRPVRHPGPDWATLAPPREVAVRSWHWLVFRSGGREGAHLAVAASPGGDPARIEVLPGWTLQWPAPGYPSDAIVVAVGAPLSDPQVELRLAQLAATLLAQLPSLPLQHVGADRTLPPNGLDQQRLRFRIREVQDARAAQTR